MTEFTDYLTLGRETNSEAKIKLAVGQLQQTVGIPGCIITYAAPHSKKHEVLVSEGYAIENLDHLTGTYLRNDPLYRDIVTGKHRPMSWRDVPEFLAGDTATRWLLPAGYRDGASISIGAGSLGDFGPSDATTGAAGYTGEMGSIHVNTYRDLTDAQLNSLLELQIFVSDMLAKKYQRDIYRLTPRELDVLRLVTSGASNPDIADELYISRRTVATHIENVLRKLGVDSRVGIAVTAVQHGLI